MIAPEFKARPRGQHDATSRASDSGAHRSDSGPGEHFSIAPLAESRALTREADDERSSTTSSHLAEEEHAGAQHADFNPAEPGLARIERADPRKVAVRLPEIAAEDARHLREFMPSPAREPPLFSLSGGWDEPSRRAPTMPAHGVGTPASASACLQPAEGGEGSVFRGAARPPRGAWGTFRVGQFWETEQPRDSKPSAEQETEQRGLFGSARIVGRGCGAGSADKPLDRAEQLVVGRVRVDAGRHHRLVAREFLREPEVFRLPVDGAAGVVTIMPGAA